MIFSSLDFLFFKFEAKKLANILNIKSEMKIAEIGAGKGNFSAYFSKLVGGNGFVCASEHDENKLHQLQKLKERNDLNNLEIVKALDESPNLPDIKFDIIFMNKVYHHFTHSNLQNLNFYQHLKLGGKLVIIDFEPKWYLRLSTPKNVPKIYGGHGIFQKVLIDEVQRVGFKTENCINNFSFDKMYCLVFVKK
jgi:ubiquinone/menaquinone biosynthesis C-methylase UbiE